MIAGLFIIIILIMTCSWLVPVGKLKRNSGALFALLLFIMLCYSVFRDGNCFLDYGSYAASVRDDIEIGEPIFVAIVWFVKYCLSAEPLCLFAIYGVLSLYLKGMAICSLTALPFFSLLIFCSDFFVLHELTQMRAGLATGIMLLSIPSIYNRNRFRFCCYTVLAAMAHLSGLLMIPLWFLNGKQIRTLPWIIILCILYAIALVGIDFVTILSYIPVQSIQNKYEFYTALNEFGDYKANIFSLLFIGKTLITLTLLMFHRLLVRNNKYGILFLKIMLLSLYALLMFSQNMAAGLRISEFYGVVCILLFPMIYYLIKPKVIAKLSISLIALVLFYVRIFSQQLILG